MKSGYLSDDSLSSLSHTHTHTSHPSLLYLVCAGSPPPPTCILGLHEPNKPWYNQVYNICENASIL